MSGKTERDLTGPYLFALGHLDDEQASEEFARWYVESGRLGLIDAFAEWREGRGEQR